MGRLTHNCEGISRRDGLKLGLRGLIAGGLSGALRATAASTSQPAESTSLAKQADACILVWLDGGPSHYETFDPKPEAPIEIRGQFSAIATQTPGIHFSQPMQRLAAISNELAIVRSIRHDQGNHGAGNHYMMTGAPPTNSGRLRRVCQFPSQSRQRRVASDRRTRGHSGLLLDAEHVEVGRSEFSGSPPRALCRSR